jgi:hypothetical protein
MTLDGKMIKERLIGKGVEGNGLFPGSRFKCPSGGTEEGHGKLQSG